MARIARVRLRYVPTLLAGLAGRPDLQLRFEEAFADAAADAIARFEPDGHRPVVVLEASDDVGLGPVPTMALERGDGAMLAQRDAERAKVAIDAAARRVAAQVRRTTPPPPAQDDLAALAGAIADANAAHASRSEPWQERIGPGDFVLTNQMIYGEIQADPSPSSGVPWIDADGRFKRWGRFYSSVCPDGEPGRILVEHVVGVLTPAQFARARELGWPSEPGGFARVVAGDPSWRTDV